MDSLRQWRLTCTGFYGALLSDEEYDAAVLTQAHLPTLNALEEHWQVEQWEMQAFIGTLSDAQLNDILRYINPGGIVRERPLWHCLFHVVNHGTQHRSEAAALLTSYGQSLGEIDFPIFLNEHSSLRP